MAETQRPLSTRREMRHRRHRLKTVWTTAAAIALTTALSGASLPAAYAIAEASGTPTQMPLAAVSSQVDSIRQVAREARTTLAEARTAMTDATTLRTDIRTAALDLGSGSTAVPLADLGDLVDRLSAIDLDTLLTASALTLPQLVDDTATETTRVAARTADVRARLDRALADKAAAEAAAAQAQADAEAAAAALAAANTPEGAQATARELAAATYGWGDDQFSCLQSLWQKESSWNYQAYNDSSGATGIPQSLPGDKMATAGADWQTSARTQIVWGLDYIDRAYGTPCAAWAKSQAVNWY